MITAAREMLCRSGMADDKVNGDMAGYLTRAELREELRDAGYVTKTELREELAIRDKRFDGIDQRLDGIDRRFDDFEQRMIHSMGQMVIAVGEEVGRQIRASNQELRIELRAEIIGSEERIRGEIRALDDQYRDLPERVARLEEHTGLKR